MRLLPSTPTARTIWCCFGAALAPIAAWTAYDEAARHLHLESVAVAKLALCSSLMVGWIFILLMPIGKLARFVCFWFYVFGYGYLLLMYAILLSGLRDGVWP
jgi:hypothetical protein